MKISIIGGGSWGATLSQLLDDNGHEVLLFDINEEFVKGINTSHKHPFFDGVFLPERIKATTSIEEAVEFSNYFVLTLPTKNMRVALKNINSVIKQPSVFINGSKGIEPVTLKRVSEIVEEEIKSQFFKGFVALTGPSHAEEVILRKLTVLVSASNDVSLAKEVQLIFNNDRYIRVYTSNDLIGCEIGGAIKNAIAVISGVSTGLGLGENARAALISRGVLEIVQIVVAMGGKKETAFGLTGIGDLIVTASSENSRNFQAGKKIGQGGDVNEVVNNSKMIVEGVRTVEAAYEIGQKFNLSLPIIEIAYELFYRNMKVDEAIKSLLTRDLRNEDI